MRRIEGYIVLTTDEVIAANEWAEERDYTRLLDDRIYDELDLDGLHVVMRQWPYTHHTASRCELLLKVKGSTEPVHTVLDIPKECLRETNPSSEGQGDRP